MFLLRNKKFLLWHLSALEKSIEILESSFERSTYFNRTPRMSIVVTVVTSNSLVVRALVICGSKPFGVSMVNSAFHPLDVGHFSNKNSWAFD